MHMAAVGNQISAQYSRSARTRSFPGCQLAPPADRRGQDRPDLSQGSRKDRDNNPGSTGVWTRERVEEVARQQSPQVSLTTPHPGSTCASPVLCARKSGTQRSPARFFRPSSGHLSRERVRIERMSPNGTTLWRSVPEESSGRATGIDRSPRQFFDREARTSPQPFHATSDMSVSPGGHSRERNMIDRGAHPQHKVRTAIRGDEPLTRPHPIFAESTSPGLHLRARVLTSTLGSDRMRERDEPTARPRVDSEVSL